MTAPFGRVNVSLDVPGPSLVHIGPCQVTGAVAYNATTTLAVLWVYDLGRTPILGVDLPTWQFPLPFAAVANQLTPPVDFTLPAGLNCQSGLAYVVCTTTADAGHTAVAAHAVQGTLDWCVSA